MLAVKAKTFGKWILAGEHSVLRGCPALAFPLLSRSLELEYLPGSQSLEVDFAGENGKDLKLLFHGVLENALNRFGVKDSPKGKFKLNSSLPVGAGLGASAALCGAVALWGEAQGFLKEEEVYEFACRLEDLFHGESSGVDLAVSLSGKGVRFVRGAGRPQPVTTAWWPRLYLSYCGQRGMTSDCVNKVKSLFESDRELALNLDKQMSVAVDLSQQALRGSPEAGRSQLIEALNLGRDCFQRWGLCQGELGDHLSELTAAGALAVKPTGSGGGGYALSLWHDEPPEPLLERLLSVPQPNLN